ncbi:CheW domain-containing protein [Pseudomonas xionganensis]|uniref:Chemotaxis protein CheW n=1 Tax=Pseudomonas xionganensis TaxID=2654845 RepID=A0A6I4KV39_9PSED|nr:CheW domain-containing protein [Pseudomonas xionganensis]MVW76235.1 chemotaxis protein CheW [Pseudomonas xionganensis]
MSRSPVIATRSQQALQSYLDGLLQEAASELAESISLDEFEAAVLEEQVRDSRPLRAASPPIARPLAEAEVRPLTLTTLSMPQPLPEVASVVEPVALVPTPAEPEVELAPTPPVQAKPATEGRPAWAEEPFECLLFDVAGLTLAVPLVCLGSIYPLSGQELTPLFGQPDWFLGILPCQAGNLKVLDTARWVMPDRYRDDFRDGLQYVISVEGYEWGLAVHQVSRSIRLDPAEVKWRSHRTQRPWLAGTVIEHMCALLDVAALAELIASGAARRMQMGRVH